MAGVKISALPAIPSAQINDLIAEVQSTGPGLVTYKATLSQVATLFNSTLAFVPLAGGTMSGALILNTNNPITDLQAASKGYVDAVAQGLNIIAAAYAATTANLTATYANGTAGVGATLTNSGALAAFAVDGVSPPINSRILVKNQTTTFQNGVYTLTTVGSGAVNWVLTRATDYDTPADINPGDFILVNNGTTNSGSGWIETAAVATIGTDPILFSRFGNQNGINRISTVKFLTNGTFTPTAGMTFCTVELIGAGGGSGGVIGLAGQAAASGGGGGAGYCKKLYTAANIGANAAVVVSNTGGAAGAAGNNVGGTGGNSTFTPSGTGVTLTANGGVGSNGSAGSAAIGIGGGAAGGTATNGDVNMSGQTGSHGFWLAAGALACSGIGGNAGFGSGMGGPSRTVNATNGSDGVQGQLYGAGGSGAINANGAGDHAGGAGSAGLCVVTEFISVSA